LYSPKPLEELMQLHDRTAVAEGGDLVLAQVTEVAQGRNDEYRE
jgi:hypothetical protein